MKEEIEFRLFYYRIIEDKISDKCDSILSRRDARDIRFDASQYEHDGFWFWTVRVSFSVSSRPRQVDLKLIYTVCQAVNCATQE